MEIQRTANAGVLLKMDGVSILLDGLCDGLEGYLPTPPDIAESLLKNPPDILAFTHGHSDHCSETLLLPYRNQKLRPILGPESPYTQVGQVTITPVATRHLGKVEPGLQHTGFVIQGSRCVWFTGDAAPSAWKGREDLPKPDVLIAPYAYANTRSALELTRSLTKKLILLHLPEPGKDPYGLWQQVTETVSTADDLQVIIPEMGEIYNI